MAKNERMDYQTRKDNARYYMGVSKNRGTSKWMVYSGKSIKMEDLGVPPF